VRGLGANRAAEGMIVGTVPAAEPRVLFWRSMRPAKIRRPGSGCPNESQGIEGDEGEAAGSKREVGVAVRRVGFTEDVDVAATTVGCRDRARRPRVRALEDAR